MAADLSVLVQPFRAKVGSLIDACARRGCELRPCMARRSPFDQAKLWRQSRSIEEITKKIDTLKAAGAPFLAKCIDQVGPQSGSLVTHAPPGFSWHQWDEAVDCFWVVRGAAEWSTRRLINGLNGYQVLADEAEKLGLTAGGHWKSLKDWPHVQLRPAAAPSDAMSVKDIDTAMKQRFG